MRMSSNNQTNIFYLLIQLETIIFQSNENVYPFIIFASATIDRISGSNFIVRFFFLLV